jgi:hypothetical protein
MERSPSAGSRELLRAVPGAICLVVWLIWTSWIGRSNRGRKPLTAQSA